jgi:lipopolysaccharide biosynthesis regulator YciM
MNSQDINLLLRNNTGNKTKESLINSFIIRIKPFKTIFLEIQASDPTKPSQNYLIIGQRGAGKTTLLYRLKYAIDDDLDLKSKIIPIMFSEEQYNLMNLTNLWESIGEYLEVHSGFESLPSEIETYSRENSYDELNIYKILENKIIENNKRIIVFIENFDVFFKKIGLDGQKRLLEVLTASHNIRLICSSTTFFEGINHLDSFDDFFKIIQLEGLSNSESIKLLYKLAEQKGELPQIQEIIKEQPKRLESLRRLTAGNPRIISYLFQIFLDNENGRAIIDLYKLLDDITYLYKAELDQLSPQQQKIIDVIARNWDAMSTKEISQKTSIDSKHVSSILKTLEKNQIIKSVSTKTKNNLYRLKDRFLNIWYLMRFGKKKDKENVVWLIRFYDIWCDQSELSKRIESHITNLKSGKYDIAVALDMGNVFLGCKNVAPEVQMDLYKTTKSILPKELMKELKLSKASIKSGIERFVKDKDFDKAVEALNEIESKDEQYYLLASWVYFHKEDLQISINFLEQLYEKNPTEESAFFIGNLISKVFSNPEKAIYFLKLALEQSKWEASSKLAQIYLNDLDDLETAENYFLAALEHNVEDNQIYSSLGKLYLRQENTSKAEKILLKGIKKKDAESAHILGHIYNDKNNWTKTEKYFLKSLDWGEISSLMCLFVSAFEECRNDKKEFILSKFEENEEKIKGNIAIEIGFARLLLWNNYTQKALNILRDSQEKLSEVLYDEENEKHKEAIIQELIIFFMFLISKNHLDAAYELFIESKIDYKQIIKPIYYVLMYHMKDEYPNEYLKAGDELKETIEEIIHGIEMFKENYN